jgi:hypothetical protein
MNLTFKGTPGDRELMLNLSDEEKAAFDEAADKLKSAVQSQMDAIVAKHPDLVCWGPRTIEGMIVHFILDYIKKAIRWLYEKIKHLFSLIF